MKLTDILLIGGLAYLASSITNAGTVSSNQDSTTTSPPITPPTIPTTTTATVPSATQWLSTTPALVQQSIGANPNLVRDFIAHVSQEYQAAGLTAPSVSSTNYSKMRSQLMMPAQDAYDNLIRRMTAIRGSGNTPGPQYIEASRQLTSFSDMLGKEIATFYKTGTWS